MAYREACEKREAAARIAVAHPEQLARDPWASHLRACPECREVCAGMARSLAVFRQVESERLAGRVGSGPSWERVELALRAEPKQRLFLRRYRVPIAAAALGGMLVFSGAGAWYADRDGTSEDLPARIVRLQPEQQQRMQQVVRMSLSGFSGNPSVASQPRPAPRLAPAEPIATEDQAVEPTGLYASGEGTLPGDSVFHRTHPFLEGTDMATTVGNGGERQNPPLFPVVSGPPGSSQVSFPIYRPNTR